MKYSYLVQYADCDAWKVAANTRGQAKRFYCDMMGLGREGFAEAGFSIQKLSVRICKGCGLQYEGLLNSRCCDSCLEDAGRAGKLAAQDILSLCEPPADWHPSMQEAFKDGFHDIRNKRKPARDAMIAEPVMLPSKRRG